MAGGMTTRASITHPMMSGPSPASPATSGAPCAVLMVADDGRGQRDGHDEHEEQLPDDLERREGEGRGPGEQAHHDHHGERWRGGAGGASRPGSIGVALPPGRVVDLLGGGLGRVVGRQVQGEPGDDDHRDRAPPHQPERQAGDDAQQAHPDAGGAAGTAGSSASRASRSGGTRLRRFARPMRIQGRRRGFSWESWRRSSTTVRTSCRVTANRSWATSPARRSACSRERSPMRLRAEVHHRRRRGRCRPGRRSGT